MEDEYVDDQRETKEKHDKLLKKRLLDKENLWQSKLDDLESEMETLSEAHK